MRTAADVLILLSIIVSIATGENGATVGDPGNEPLEKDNGYHPAVIEEFMPANDTDDGQLYNPEHVSATHSHHFEYGDVIAPPD